MKKSLILLVALAAMIFASCSKDDDDDPTKTKDGKALVTKIIKSYSGGSSEEFSFTYDTKGNITKALYKYTSYRGSRTEEKTFDTEGNKITETKKRGDHITYKWHTFDANGQVLKTEESDNDIIIFTYNKNGERIKREEGDYETTYSWSNGNMVQTGNTTLEYYTEYPNINIELGQLAHEEFDYAENHFGNKNLLKAEIWSSRKIEYEYDFDGKKVTTIKMYSTENNEERRLGCTYHLYYE